MKDETKITVTGSPSKKETKQVVANNTDKDGTLKSDKEKSFVIPLEKLIEKAKEHEPPPFIWRGIKKGSCGYIFGPAKSGKTIFCENLGLMLSLGADLFLESPLLKGNHKVLIISLEEYWEHRSERNIKQITRLSKEYGDKWKEYYFVADENAPRYFTTSADWLRLDTEIKKNVPDIVIIDSLTRLYSGDIESSKKAKEVSERLMELTYENKITLVAIHHTPKEKDSPITIESLAGSRVLAQEADFMIGINKFSSGRRYMKDVAFRYKQESEAVIEFSITEDLLIKPEQNTNEVSLLSDLDRRTDSTNRHLILNYVTEQTLQGNIVPTGQIIEKFVTTGTMSRQTFFDNVNYLIHDGKIVQPEKGTYIVKL